MKYILSVLPKESTLLLITMPEKKWEKVSTFLSPCEGAE